MSAPALVTCRGAPGYGGASTYAYVLFEVLLELGIPAHYVTIADRELARFCESRFGDRWWNPRALPGVHLGVVVDYNQPPSPELRRILRRIRPRLAIVKNDVAPRLVRNALPDVQTWFLTSSSKPMKEACEQGFAASLQDGMRKLERGAPWPYASARERGAVSIGQRIVCDSDVTKTCFEKLYPKHAHKVDPRVLWAASTFERHLGCRPRKPFASRSVDVLFVANRWNRVEKQYPAVEELVRRLPNREVHIVGNAPEPVDGACHHGPVPHDRVVELMGDTKTVVSTSLYDSSPNILFEAALMGCNVVASKNCGNWRVCHPELLVESHRPAAFVERVSRSLAGELASDLAPFVDDDPLEPFVERVRATLSGRSPGACAV